MSKIEKPPKNDLVSKYEEDNLSLDLCLGKFDPLENEDFVVIPKMYADKTGLYLRKEVLQAFIEMFTHAQKDRIDLIIKSATRNFDYQKIIWEKKWSGKTTLSDGTNLSKGKWSDVDKALKILEYSSMPGTSRHHWGTDIDLNAFNNAYFQLDEGLRVYSWLIHNAHKYGFCQPYSSKSMGRTGYNEEKWHWSYLPISTRFTSYMNKHFSDQLLNDFKGSQTAEIIAIKENYILGIDPACFSHQ